MSRKQEALGLVLVLGRNNCVPVFRKVGVILSYKSKATSFPASDPLNDKGETPKGFVLFFVFFMLRQGLEPVILLPVSQSFGSTGVGALCAFQKHLMFLR